MAITMSVPTLRRVASTVLALVLCTSAILGMPKSASAEALPLKPGTVWEFASADGNRKVSIETLGYPDDSPSICKYWEFGRELWTRTIPTTPSKVAISDDGSTIAMTNWGWYDEGASRNLSIYAGDGRMVQELTFADSEGSWGGMKWVRVLALSPDGSRCIVGTDSNPRAVFSCYDTKSGLPIWENGYGFGDARGAVMPQDGKHALLATSDYHTGDMSFLLVNANGDAIWQRELKANLSWDVGAYIGWDSDGKSFWVYDLKGNERIKRTVP